MLRKKQVTTISTKEQPMNDGDDRAQPEVVFKADELLESKFVIHYRRTEGSALAEAGFCALLLMTGLAEVISYSELLCGYCLICAGILFFCLFLQFYLGVIFNCWPLLICHAFEAGGMFICIFTFLMCSLVLSYPAQIVVTPYRNSLMLTLSSSIITSVLLATFAASSFSRGREVCDVLVTIFF
ncbi:hypothetical protein OESDEN_07280, partial [Oesophagostomum dentatum]